MNQSAFGLGPGSVPGYTSEEGFEVLSFNGQLYVGMEADNSLGARLWRSRSGVAIPQGQEDWEEVVADANGLPFGVGEVLQNDHIDSLAEFNGYLYVSTANGGSSTLGTRVFRSPNGNPGTWEDAIAAYGAGFGSVFNTNFKDMQVFQGSLCGGTQNWSTGAQVWCTQDGTTWTRKDNNSFGEGSRLIEVWSGYVFNGYLYMGVEHLGAARSTDGDNEGRLYRTNSLNGTPNWVRVYTSPATGVKRVDILGELDGYLYIAVPTSQGVTILRSASGAEASWSQVNLTGMNGLAANAGTVVDGAVTYNGALYVAVSNTTGLTVWRTSGVLQPDGSLVDWTQIDSLGLGDPKNVHAQLIAYNGYLYAWTSNYTSGQQVLQTECGYEETLPVSQAGVDYVFDPSIGAQIRFSELGTVTQVTVRAYPGAWDAKALAMNGVLPVKRHYRIETNGSNYVADMTVTYQQAEFEASEIPSEATTYQAIWSGQSWQACPPASQQRDPEANLVYCGGLTNLADITITGGGIPTAVTLTRLEAQREKPATAAVAGSMAFLLLGGLLTTKIYQICRV